jgi:hypothetical protein
MNEASSVSIVAVPNPITSRSFTGPTPLCGLCHGQTMGRVDLVPNEKPSWRRLWDVLWLLSHEPDRIFVSGTHRKPPS